MSGPAEVELRYSTHDETIDRGLRGYIAAFQATFPGRLLRGLIRRGPARSGAP